MKDQDKNTLSDFRGILANAVVTMAATKSGFISPEQAPILSGAGAMAVDLIKNIIPNRRLDKIESLVLCLDERMKNVEEGAEERINERYQTPEFGDLFEEAVYQSARALSPDRIAAIANVLKNSLTDEQMGHDKRKRILQIVSELNDTQLKLLQAYALHGEEARQFWIDNPELTQRSAYMGASMELIDAATMQENYRDHLVSLGLLNSIPNGNFPPRLEISGLGRMLLHEIGGRDPLRRE